MALNVSILYRGPLSGCNYACPYCPFSERRASRAEARQDRLGLERFQRWAAGRTSDRLAVFFTPRGEALLHGTYREAVVALSRMDHVRKVAVQTNLSCELDWLDAAEPRKVGLWCTYHPSQTALPAFAAQCERLGELGIRYSVGCVGLKEHLPEIGRLRESLPSDRYVWINAYKDVPNYYDDATLRAFERIDPLFPINRRIHVSLHRPCKCGRAVFAVDGSGDVRRCHFVRRVLGNIYRTDLADMQSERPCPNPTCHCHIGYVHLEHLKLETIFGDGLLERVVTAPASQ